MKVFFVDIAVTVAALFFLLLIIYIRH